jgi:hypothetical protein
MPSFGPCIRVKSQAREVALGSEEWRGLSDVNSNKLLLFMYGLIVFVKEPWPSLTCKRRKRLPEMVNVIIAYGGLLSYQQSTALMFLVTDAFCTEPIVVTPTLSHIGMPYVTRVFLSAALFLVRREKNFFTCHRLTSCKYGSNWAPPLLA